MATPTTRTAAPGKSATKMAAGAKTSIPNLQVDDLMTGYVPARLPEGTVVGVWGRAIIRPAGGQPRPLVVGDEVHKGDMILTSQNGIVQIQHEGDRLARIPDPEALENMLVALNAGDAPPAAGFGGDGNLQPGLRLDRLYEVVSAQEYAYDAAQLASGIALRAAVDDATPTVISVEPGGPGTGDDGVLEGTGTANQLVFTVTLSRASTGTVSFPISIGSGDAPANGYAGSTDYDAATFSNGVVRNADGTLTVPAGVSSFTITIPTHPDGAVEPNEALPVTVGGVTGTGVILNDDAPPQANPDSGAATENSTTTVQALNGVIQGAGTSRAGADTDDYDPTARLTVTGVAAGAGAVTQGVGVGTSLVGTYGHLTLNADGSYTYVADRADSLATGATGQDVFSYTVKDFTGDNVSNVTTLTITVTGVNDPPVANADAGAVDEDAGLATTALTGVVQGAPGADSDVDNATATLQVSGVAVGTGAITQGAGIGTALAGTYGHLTLNADGSYTYIADQANQLAAGVKVQDVFTYTVKDPDGAVSNATTLTITITGTNDAPVAVADVGAVVEDQTLTHAAADGIIQAAPGTDTDVDNATSELRVSGAVAGTGAVTQGVGLDTVLTGTYGHLTIHADGSYTYVADRADALAYGTSDQDVFSYTVKDPSGAVSNSTTLTITVAGANDAPTIDRALPNQASQDAATVSYATASGFKDVDSGDTLTYSAAQLPAGLTIDTATGVISGTLASDASVRDPYTIEVTATDSRGASVSQTFVLTVSNPAPVASNDGGAVNEDATVSVTAANGVILSGSNAAGRDIDPDGDSPLTVTDVRAGSETATGSAVAAGNVLAGSYGHLTLNADGSYSYVADNANALKAGATAVDTFTYTVSDGQGGFDKAELSITVTGVNDPPAAADDGGSAREDARIDVSAANGVILSAAAAAGRDSDPDGDALVVSGVRTGAETGSGTAGVVGQSLAGSFGHLTLNADGSYSYIADLADSLAEGVRATDTFTYTVSDGQGGFDTAQLVITVTGSNDAPRPQPDGLGTGGNGTNEDTAATGNVLANDLDPDTPNTGLSVLSFTVAGATYTAGQTAAIAGVGSLQLNANGSYTFTPAADYHNTASNAPVVTYTLSDGSLNASSTLTLRVIPVPDAVPDGGQTWEGRAVVIDVLANDKFSDGTARITQLNGQAVAAGDGTKVPVNDGGTQVGTVTLKSDGTVSFEPVAGYSNTVGTEARFTYTVSAGGSTESATALVKVDAALPLTDLTPLRAWTFDQTSGTTTLTVNNEGDSAQTGTLQGSATLVSGHIGDALRLDGTVGYMKFAANANGADNTSASLLEAAASSAASLSFWVKVAAGQTGGGAVIGCNSSTTTDTGQNMQWGLLNAAGQIGVARGSGSGNQVFSATAVNDGNWHHVVISCGPAGSGTQSVAIWVDGSLDASGGVKVDSEHLSFSGFGVDNAVGTGNGSDRYFNGTLDDIRVQSGLLDEESVAAIYTAEKAWASNTDTSHMVIDNDNGSISFAIAGSPSSLQFSGAPDGAVLSDNLGHSVAFTGGVASLASTAGWNVDHLQISGLGSDKSAQIAVYATLSDAALSAAKVTIDVVAGHAATASNETWTSGAGSDVFRWELADAGTTTTPGQDVIKAFNGSSSVASGGDVLDLRDLLVGETAATIENYLQIDLPGSSGGNTTIHVSSSGGFAGGSTTGNETQTIVLEGSHLATSLGLAATATDQQVIAEMLKQGKLMIDN